MTNDLKSRESITDDAVRSWLWLSDPKNSAPLPPIVDSPEARAIGDETIEELHIDCVLAAVPRDARIFSTNTFHKALFRGGKKDEVNAVLDLLETVGVVGSAFQADLSGTGRFKEARHLAAKWQNAEMESELRQLLSDALEINQAADRQESAAAETEAREAASAIAIAIYNWASDVENVELDRGHPVVSLGRMAKDIADPEPGLALLRKHGVLGDRFVQPDYRKRTLLPLVPKMFGSGERERVIALLTPKPPAEYRQYGPLRVLNVCSVSLNGVLWRLKAGEVITDEPACAALVRGNAPVCHVDDLEACFCPRCRLKFKESEQATREMPVLIALKDFLQNRNGCPIRRKQGDFITDPGNVEHLLKHFASVVAVADRWRYQICPACQTAAMRPQLQAVSE